MREGYPSKRVNPGWRAKESPGFTSKILQVEPGRTWDNLMRGYIQRGLETIRMLTRVVNPTWVTREKVNPTARVTLARG